MSIENLPRDSDGRLSAWAWPGGYPFFYLDGDSSVLCVNCARRSDEDEDEIPQFKPIAFDVNYDDEVLYCDDCSERLDAAYED